MNQSLREWWDAMEANHAMVLASLRHKIGPDGDLQAAYREWYAWQRELAEARIDAAARKYELQKASISEPK